ncbi:hypothetical protein [Streptacidiphilus sp. PAMC 29251]
MSAFLAHFWAVVYAACALFLLAIPAEAAVRSARHHRSPEEG